MRYYARTISLILLIAISAIFLSPQFAIAQESEVSADPVARGLAPMVYIALSTSNLFIAKLVGIIQYLLAFRITDALPIVQNSWSIVRDFANMLFIVVLIVMAFATIFNVKTVFGGDLQAMLARFIIAALLINFSLAIGSAIILGSDIVSNTFLYSIGDFQARMGKALDVTNILPPGLPDPNSVWGKVNFLLKDLTYFQFFQLIFVFLISLVVLLSLVVAAVVVGLRVPILMTLLVFAPAAWLFSILPTTRHFSKGWWNQFLGWTLFLPFYLFILYFGFFFLQNAPVALSNVATGTTNPFLEGLGKSSQVVYYYFLASFIFIGGTLAAVKSSFFTGSGVTSIASGVRTKLLGSTIGTPYRAAGTRIAGGVAGGIYGAVQGTREGGVREGLRQAAQGVGSAGKFYEGAKKGIARSFGERVKEGFGPFYGGTRQAEQVGARAEQAFGGRGAVRAQLKKDVGDYKKLYEEREMDAAQLREIVGNDTLPAPQRLAAYESLKDKKVLTGDELLKAYELYTSPKGGSSPTAAATFMSGIEFDKLTKAERTLLFGGIQDADIRKKIARVIAKEGEFENSERVADALRLFKDKEQSDFLGEIRKKQLLEALEAGEILGLLKDEDGTILDFNEALKKGLTRLAPKDTVKFLSDELLSYAGVGGRIPPTTPADPKKIPSYNLKLKALPQIAQILKDRLKDTPGDPPEVQEQKRRFREKIYRVEELTPDKQDALRELLS